MRKFEQTGKGFHILVKLKFLVVFFYLFLKSYLYHDLVSAFDSLLASNLISPVFWSHGKESRGVTSLFPIISLQHFQSGADDV